MWLQKRWRRFFARTFVAQWRFHLHLQQSVCPSISMTADFSLMVSFLQSWNVKSFKWKYMKLKHTKTINVSTWAFFTTKSIRLDFSTLSEEHTRVWKFFHQQNYTLMNNYEKTLLFELLNFMFHRIFFLQILNNSFQCYWNIGIVICQCRCLEYILEKLNIHLKSPWIRKKLLPFFFNCVDFVQF